MNRYSRVIGGAWALAMTVIAASAAAWSTAIPIVDPERPTASHREGTRFSVASVPDTNRLSSSAKSLRDHDPFRFERKPTGVRFNPSGPNNQQVAPPPPAPPRPALRLVGIIGGPPWTTVVEGVPGRESGVLLRVGEDVGGIRLTTVGGDSAVFAGFDTTWVLRAKAPWR